MKKRLRSNSGVTLIELLLAMLIVTVVLAATYGALATGAKTFNMNVENSMSQQGLRAAMEQITREVRSASAVTPGASSLTFTVEGKDKAYTIIDGYLCYAGNAIASDISGISSSVAGKILTVTLTASDGATLTTQMHIE